MAQKLKKSKVKPRSQRSIEEEQKKLAAIEAYEAAQSEKKGVLSGDTLTTIFAWYSVIASVFSVFLGFWGIFSVMAIVFGALALYRMKGADKKIDFYAAWIGIVIGVIWLIVQIVVLIQRV